jgi:hypothetical protein
MTTAAAPRFVALTAPLPEAAPEPGSLAEKAAFARLQQGLGPIFRTLFPDPHAPQTIVIVPSISLDEAELPKLVGACRYEERLLCLLMLLRRPGIRIIYLSSRRIDPDIINYCLSALSGVSQADARRRLMLLDCDDSSPACLTRKLLQRPALLGRVRELLGDPAAAHMTCFTATPLERTLAVRLGIPLYGCDPELAHLGTKSGSRRVLRQAGVPVPPGSEDLRDLNDVVDALCELKQQHPDLARAVVKLNDGFSGEGNAVFPFAGAPAGRALRPWVAAGLPEGLRFVAPDEQFETFCAKLERMEGVVEAFVEGAGKRSPSVQCRIDPLGHGGIISTHEQLLGGLDGQVFMGCAFPADGAYVRELHDGALRTTGVLQQEGVLGRFGIDYISRPTPGGWEHFALEINLRKGGTTHPFLALQLLTDGEYSSEEGVYRTGSGEVRSYVASDNLGGRRFRGWRASSLIDLAGASELHFDQDQGSGVMFHLLGALEEHGKFGALSIAGSPAGALRLHDRMRAVFSPLAVREARPAPRPPGVMARARRRYRPTFADGNCRIIGRQP